MTTPAACVDAWRAMPSSRRATPSSSSTFGSACSQLLQRRRSPRWPCRASCRARRESAWRPCWRRPAGCRARAPTSRTAAFAFIVPNVMIWATFSRPYFRVTYSMTSPRRRSQKSMSISGSDTRSGLRKRSKMRSVLQRIDVGDAQAVRDEAASRRSAARADRNPLLARVADEVPDDQEVPGVAHPLDHRRSRTRAAVRSRRDAWRREPADTIARRRGSRSAKPWRTMCSKYVIERVALGHAKSGRWFSVPLEDRRCSARRCAPYSKRLRETPSRRRAPSRRAVFRKNWSP